MGVRLITPPVVEPVSMAAAKSQLRIEHSLDDALIADQIKAARQYVEDVTWRALVTQTWELVLDAFPARGFNDPFMLGERFAPWRRIDLPKGFIQSVTSVKYDDPSGVEQTFPSSNYVVDNTVEGKAPRLVLKTTSDWPSTSGEAMCIRVRFVAGYGGPEAVPAPLKAAMLLLISQLYEQRTPEVTGTIISPVKFSFDSLVANYRVNGF